MIDWIAKQKIASEHGARFRTADPFKGQCGLSLRNDFNQQWPETARIATLSQRIALTRGPNSFFPGGRNPPTMLSIGVEDPSPSISRLRASGFPTVASGASSFAPRAGDAREC
jgi:hypothetical protein